MPVNESAWIMGFLVAGVVVVVVVAVVLTIILLARQIRTQTAHATLALLEARDNSDALWEMEKMRRRVEDIRDLARAARERLTS